MKPVDFEGSNCVYAKDQPPYLPLPVCRDATPEVKVMSCWELEEEDVLVVQKALAAGERPVVWLTMLTFGEPLQPVVLTAVRPEIKVVES